MSGARSRANRSVGRRRAYRRGLAAERFAEWLLRLKGYRTLARRFSASGGEIDLVMRRRDIVVFVEVKARTTLEEGLTAVGPRSQARTVNAARAWLTSHPRQGAATLRFDVVIVTPGRLPRHIVNAFPATIV